MVRGDGRHYFDGVVTRAYVYIIHQSYLLLEEKLSTPAPSTASLQRERPRVHESLSPQDQTIVAPDYNEIAILRAF